MTDKTIVVYCAQQTVGMYTRRDRWRWGEGARQVLLAPEFLDLSVGAFNGGDGMVVNAAELEDGGLESCTIVHDQVMCNVMFSKNAMTPGLTTGPVLGFKYGREQILRCP